MAPELVVPDYAGGCLSTVMPALDEPGRPAEWLPEEARDADQIVLLVLDGLGWNQLNDRAHLAPRLASMSGGSITSVAPSTTATALTSITLGVPPAEHGVLGYRVRVDGDEILNVLRWSTSGVDARASVPPDDFSRGSSFGGRRIPVVTRGEFRGSGFTDAHLGGTSLVGWYTSSGIPVEVGRLLASGERLVYAYYDGVDKIAHIFGFGPHYDAELRATDRLVADLVDALPPGACLLVTADHGQVQVGDALHTLPADVLDDVALVSGEGRFRWLHARAGVPPQVIAARLADRYEGDGIAWVRTREQVIDEGWFGGTPRPEVMSRIGDVAVLARAPVAFIDENDRGSLPLVCRHGSLTPDEMLVPLLAARR
ncbi:MAG TPA: alkaline phosphatase family protein [Acidimicrobiales bacterium]|nr:alkaline phosphatase family protein [Acidimicrobiales bacterium]